MSPEMPTNSLSKQFEKEVRRLYPSGAVTQTEWELLLELATAQGL